MSDSIGGRAQKIKASWQYKSSLERVLEINQAAISAHPMRRRQKEDCAVSG